MDERQSFGSWLRRRRRALDLTQDELARQLGYTAATIKKIEQDERRPSRELAERLAVALQVPADERDVFLKSARGHLAADRLGTVPGEATNSPPAPRPVTNLPIRRERLIGRNHEMAQVRDLLLREDIGLVTLTGPGGVGKTRLALAVAAELQVDYANGVFLVDLAPITDPMLVGVALARALGIQESSAKTITDSLRTFLRPRHLLLVLDNFEQVVTAAPVVAHLLATASRLSIVVTSRVPLHLTGEHEVAVGPLALPELHELPPVVELSQVAAVELFVTRAQATNAAFKLTAENASAVATICVRLDGLPLTLELAAARTKLFTPQALLERLDRRLSLLTSGACDLPARQQTLRATLDWSYNLLEPPVQQLFGRLAVFAGGWTMEACEVVCRDEPDPDLAVADRLQALVDNSLVRQLPTSAGDLQFTMLETIREYALERLADSGELSRLRQSHAEYFLALAEQADQQLRGPDQVAWLAMLEREHANLRAALGWFNKTTDRSEQALRLAAALWNFWLGHSHLQEGRTWLEGALERHDDVADSALTRRAYAHFGAAMITRFLADFAAALRHGETAQDLYHQVNDPWSTSATLMFFGMGPRAQDGRRTGESLLEQDLAHSRALGDAWATFVFLCNLAGSQLANEGPSAEHERRAAEALDLSRKVGNPQLMALALRISAELALRMHDDAQARALHRESLALIRIVGTRNDRAEVLWKMGTLALRERDIPAASECFTEGLREYWAVGSTCAIAGASLGLGHVAALQQQTERAATLYGVAQAIVESASTQVDGGRRAEVQEELASAQQQLPPGETTARAWAAGRAMALEQAIAYALEGTG